MHVSVESAPAFTCSAFGNIPLKPVLIFFSCKKKKTLTLDLFKNRGHDAELWNQNLSLWIICRRRVNALQISLYTYPRRRHAAISGMWNEQCFWQPAHLIYLTLKKTEHLWQTGQWENRAVNLDCGGKWTDRSGGVSSVCEQRCISVDTPRHFCVPSNLMEKTTSSVWGRYSFWIFSHLIRLENVSGYTEDVKIQSCASSDKGIIQT